MFLETLVVSDLLPFERPIVTAHEWAHLAGYNDEGEANFVGWLSCMRGDEPRQYSAWIFLFSEAVSQLPRGDRQQLAQQLDAGPRDDLRAIADRGAQPERARGAGGLAGVQPVSASQPRRVGNGQLRRGDPARSRHAIQPQLTDPATLKCNHEDTKTRRNFLYKNVFFVISCFRGCLCSNAAESPGRRGYREDRLGNTHAPGIAQTLVRSASPARPTTRA